MSYEFTTELWHHPGEAGWHFISLPDDLADEIRARHADEQRPFGSLPVEARVGDTSWTTSIFADTKRGTFLLPVRADVRRREKVGDGDVVSVSIELG